jgi:hypothetical protein
MPKPKKRRKPNPIGRPTLLTPQVSKKICSFIMAGAFGHAAAEVSGISEMTYLEWLRRGEDTDSHRPTNEAYAKFAKDVRLARANARVAAEINVKTMDSKWWMARMYRKDWGDSPTQLEVTNTNTLSAAEFQVMLERLTDDQRETFLDLWNIMTGRVPVERPAIETTVEIEKGNHRRRSYSVGWPRAVEIVQHGFALDIVSIWRLDTSEDRR